jgi:hypothetical protein
MDQTRDNFLAALKKRLPDVEAFVLVRGNR